MSVATDPRLERLLRSVDEQDAAERTAAWAAAYSELQQTKAVFDAEYSALQSEAGRIREEAARAQHAANAAAAARRVMAHKIRRAYIDGSHRLERLTAKVRSLADPRIDVAIGRLFDLPQPELKRRSEFTNQHRADGRRAQVIRSNDAALKRWATARMAARDALEALKVQPATDLAAEIERIVKSLPDPNKMEVWADERPKKR